MQLYYFTESKKKKNDDDNDNNNKLKTKIIKTLKLKEILDIIVTFK